jgi:hypothetical protein
LRGAWGHSTSENRKLTTLRDSPAPFSLPIQSVRDTKVVTEVVCPYGSIDLFERAEAEKAEIIEKQKTLSKVFGQDWAAEE